MTHTPGPWEVLSRSIYQVDAIGGREVVHGNGIKGRDNNQEREANARLIAAAPELLAALKGLVGAHLSTPGPRGVMLDVPHFLKQAEATIAKAEGAS
jgi:hypothetical protein